MEEKQFIPRVPDYKGYIEVAAWVSQGEDNKPEIKIRLGTKATLKKFVPKPKEPKEIQI